jgi:hypothetical protein
MGTYAMIWTVIGRGDQANVEDGVLTEEEREERVEEK